MLIYIRSLFFNVISFLYMFISFSIGAVLVLIFKFPVFKFWELLSRGFDFCTQKFAGIKYKIINKGNILKGPAIYVIRHESTWETLVMIHFFKEPVFILKKELLDIPLFGSLSKAAKVIAIDRAEGVKSLIKITKNAEEMLDAGHPVILFPEGTRVATGEHVPIKRGISMFYKKTQYPIIPIIHNAGFFWPRRGFTKKAGEVTIKVLEPIKKGLSTDEFMDTLNQIFYDEIEKLKKNKKG